MSNFYKHYCDVNKKEYPEFLANEVKRNEIHKMHVNQTKMETNSKHTGSVKLSRMMYHIHNMHSTITTMYKQFAKH